MSYFEFPHTRDYDGDLGYIIKKIEESKKLISQNKYTFTEIAYRLNFNSVHYFSRLFKLHTSQTPTEYAKSIKIDHVL